MLNPNFRQVDLRTWKTAIARAEAATKRSKTQVAKRESINPIGERNRNYWSYRVRGIEVAQKVDTLANGAIVASCYFVAPHLVEVAS